jgi:hypothetical protein
MTELQQIVLLLKDIKVNQEKIPPFSTGGVLAMLLANSIAYVIALSLSNAFITSFKLIPISSDGVVGSWLYVAVILPIGIFLLYVILVWLQPFLKRKLDKKTKENK